MSRHVGLVAPCHVGSCRGSSCWSRPAKSNRVASRWSCRVVSGRVRSGLVGLIWSRRVTLVSSGHVGSHQFSSCHVMLVASCRFRSRRVTSLRVGLGASYRVRSYHALSRRSCWSGLVMSRPVTSTSCRVGLISSCPVVSSRVQSRLRWSCHAQSNQILSRPVGHGASRQIRSRQVKFYSFPFVCLIIPSSMTKPTSPVSSTLAIHI